MRETKILQGGAMNPYMDTESDSTSKKAHLVRMRQGIHSSSSSRSTEALETPPVSISWSKSSSFRKTQSRTIKNLGRNRSQQCKVINGQKSSSTDNMLTKTKLPTKRITKLRTRISKTSSDSLFDSSNTNEKGEGILRHSEMKVTQSENLPPRQSTAEFSSSSQNSQCLHLFEKESSTVLPNFNNHQFEVQQYSDASKVSLNENLPFLFKPLSDTQKCSLNEIDVSISKSMSGGFSSMENSPMSLKKQKQFSTTETLKTETSNTDTSHTINTLSSIACGAALSFVGGVGFAVEKIAADLGNLADCRDDDNFSSISRKGSNLTLDTYGENLRDDMDQIERMTSWDTLETMTTAHTATTNASKISNGSISPLPTNDESIHALPEIDDDGNTISPRVLKSLRRQLSVGRKNDNSEKKLQTSSINNTKQEEKASSKPAKGKERKKVMFDYPPISSMKNCPRITSEERDALFFTEDELDQMADDRRYNLNDDVEVVAIQTSKPKNSPLASEEERRKKKTHLKGVQIYLRQRSVQ